MSAVAVAQGRRHSIIQRMNRRIEYLNGEIGRGTNGANGMHNDYLAERVNSLIGERDRLAAEIERLNGASDEDLVAELVWEDKRNKALEENPPPPLRDVLTARGPMPPSQVVVNREPLPVQCEGGSPGVPWEHAAGGPPGWVPGQVYTYPTNDG